MPPGPSSWYQVQGALWYEASKQYRTGASEIVKVSQPSIRDQRHTFLVRHCSFKGFWSNAVRWFVVQLYCSVPEGARLLDWMAYLICASSLANALIAFKPAAETPFCLLLIRKYSGLKANLVCRWHSTRRRMGSSGRLAPSSPSYRQDITPSAGWREGVFIVLLGDVKLLCSLSLSASVCLCVCL